MMFWKVVNSDVYENDIRQLLYVILNKQKTEEYS